MRFAGHSTHAERKRTGERGKIKIRRDVLRSEPLRVPVAWAQGHNFAESTNQVSRRRHPFSIQASQSKFALQYLLCVHIFFIAFTREHSARLEFTVHGFGVV